MGTLVVIAMTAASLIFPLTKIVIGYILVCLLYFKFLYDIKRKLYKKMSELNK